VLFTDGLRPDRFGGVELWQPLGLAAHPWR
jgi:hypothetical protein